MEFQCLTIAQSLAIYVNECWVDMKIKVVEAIWGCLPKHQHIFNDIIKGFLQVISSCLSCKQTFLQLEYNK
jgi:hypothetical protein